MSDLSQASIDEKEKDLEFFKKAGWEEADLDHFYETSKYIESTLRDRENHLYLRPEDFAHFCSYIDKKISFFEHLYLFVQMYFEWRKWDEKNVNVGDKALMLGWIKEYRHQHMGRSVIHSVSPSEMKTQNTQGEDTNVTAKSHRHHFLLLAIEISRLSQQLLDKIQSGAVTIANSDLQDFYRLPWLWHYGTGELKEMKATLSSELAEPEQEADSLIIGTILELPSDIRITPEIKGSEMRAVFETLAGKTFKLICDFRMVDLGKSSVKFYRIP